MPEPGQRPPSRRAARIGAALLALTLSAAALAATLDVEEHRKATAAILCDCGCHPQSVKDCTCGRAEQMRNEIADRMLGEDGGGPLNADDLIALYVANHGEQILVAPPVRGFNLLAWLGPFVVLILAVTGVTLLVRHLTTRQTAPSVAAVPDAPALDPADPYLNQLQRELEERR